jgi:hypothetical protein
MAGKKKTRSRSPRKPKRRSRSLRPAKIVAKKPRRATRAVTRKRRVPASKGATAPRRPQETLEALARRIRRLGAVRARLERRLTEAVQEIGMLRRFELRARELEGELEKREEELATARRELALLLPGAAAARP